MGAKHPPWILLDCQVVAYIIVANTIIKATFAEDESFHYFDQEFMDV